MPLVRWQFRGLPDEERRAFLFTDAKDVKGKRYTIPVVVGCLAASRKIYAFGFQFKPEDIVDKWTQAEANPILPIVKALRFYREEVLD